MEQIIKNWERKYGYKPTMYEIVSAYRNGMLELTDYQENQILKIIDNYE